MTNVKLKGIDPNAAKKTRKNVSKTDMNSTKEPTSFQNIKSHISSTADLENISMIEKIIKKGDLDDMVLVLKQDHPILSKLQVQTIAFLLN